MLFIQHFLIWSFYYFICTLTAIETENVMVSLIAAVVEVAVKWIPNAAKQKIIIIALL